MKCEKKTKNKVIRKKIKIIDLPHCIIERGNAIIGKMPKISITHNVANRSDKSEFTSLKSSGSLSRFMTENISYCPTSMYAECEPVFCFVVANTLGNMILYRAHMA